MAILLQYLTLGDSTDGYAEYTTHVVSMVHAKDHIITASKENPDYLENVFNDFKTKDEIVYEHIVLDVFSAIQKNTIEKLREIHEDIEEMQNDIQKSSKSKELYRLIAIDKSLTKIQTAVQNNRKVLDQLNDSGRFDHSNEAAHVLHDVLVESLQAESMVEQATRIVNLLNDLFGNVISNNLNQIMKVLTSITIVLTIPTITGSLWGMNTPVPMEHNDFGFIIIVVISIIISVIVAFWLWKKDYLYINYQWPQNRNFSTLWPFSISLLLYNIFDVTP